MASETCPACDGAALPGCAVCRGVGTVLPMRVDAYHRCQRIVARLRASGGWTDEMRETLGLTPRQWDELRAGTLPVVYVERVEAAL